MEAKHCVPVKSGWSKQDKWLGGGEHAIVIPMILGANVARLMVRPRKLKQNNLRNHSRMANNGRSATVVAAEEIKNRE